MACADALQLPVMSASGAKAIFNLENIIILFVFDWMRDVASVHSSINSSLQKMSSDSSGPLYR